MTLAQVLDWIEKQGKPGTARIYARHGVRERSVGLTYSDLGALLKKLRVDQELAEGLWRSGIHDARVLATKVADPALITRKRVEGWLGEATNYIITDALSALVAKMPEALEMALDWILDDDEWATATGWNVISLLAMEGTLAEAVAAGLLSRIERSIHEAPNRTRHSMNQALIAIGRRSPGLRKAALATARTVGKVEVDHGGTGCKTPDAAAYIEKMSARSPKRARITGARMKAIGAKRANVKTRLP